MKVSCDNCSARYSIADDKLRGKMFKVRCKKCGHAFVLDGSASASGVPGDDGGGEEVWHLVVEREQVGPMSAAAVRSRFRAREVDGGTYAWREGFAEWVPLRSIDAFADLRGAGEERLPPRSGEIVLGRPATLPGRAPTSGGAPGARNPSASASAPGVPSGRPAADESAREATGQDARSAARQPSAPSPRGHTPDAPGARSVVDARAAAPSGGDEEATRRTSADDVFTAHDAQHADDDDGDGEGEAAELFGASPSAGARDARHADTSGAAGATSRTPLAGTTDGPGSGEAPGDDDDDAATPAPVGVTPTPLPAPAPMLARAAAAAGPSVGARGMPSSTPSRAAASRPSRSRPVVAPTAAVTAAPAPGGGTRGAAPDAQVDDESSRARRARLKGERNDNSLLFSIGDLRNVQRGERPSSAASEPRPGYATAKGEGSGLVDVRAMAALTLSRAAEGERARGGGALDGGPIGAPASIDPILLPEAPAGPPSWVWAVLGLAALGVLTMSLVLVMMLRQQSEAQARLLAVTARSGAVRGASGGGGGGGGGGDRAADGTDGTAQPGATTHDAERGAPKQGASGEAATDPAAAHGVAAANREPGGGAPHGAGAGAGAGAGEGEGGDPTRGGAAAHDRSAAGDGEGGALGTGRAVHAGGADGRGAPGHPPREANATADGGGRARAPAAPDPGNDGARPARGSRVAAATRERPSSRTRTSSSSEARPAPQPSSPPRRRASDDDIDALLKGSGHAPRAAAPTEAPRAVDPSLPEQLGRDDVRAGFVAVLPRAQACGARFHTTGMVTVAVVIGGNGRVTSAEPKAPFGGSPVGDCVRGAVRSATFKHFRGAPMSISYPIILR